MPDSCCIRQSLNCGRQTSSQGHDRTKKIYTDGCLGNYLNQFRTDIRYLSVMSTIFSILFLINALALFYLFRVLKQNVAHNNLAQARRPTVTFQAPLINRRNN